MTPFAPPEWRWQLHANLASTQDHAIALAQKGEFGRLAILADIQTDGRGSRGRSWIAPAGNLNFSALLRPTEQLPDPGRWAMLAGIALHDAMTPYAQNLMLKWPNDVLMGGAKLGGILIDSSLTPDGMLDWVVIGIGANLAKAPRIEGRATACLSSSPPALAVAHRVAALLDTYMDQSLAELRDAWLSRAHKPGDLLSIRTNSRTIEGAFSTITDHGALILQGHPFPITAGEVFLAQHA